MRESAKWLQTGGVDTGGWWLFYEGVGVSAVVACRGLWLFFECGGVWALLSVVAGVLALLSAGGGVLAPSLKVVGCGRRL